MKFLVDWLGSLIDLCYPRLCLICERSLMGGEEYICLHCLSHIPETGYHRWPDNPMEQLFYGKVSVERAFGFFYFTPEGNFRKLIHAIKYKGEKEAASSLGRLYALRLKESGILDTVDLIVPVPLHKKKQRQRGYNQSEWIAKGISGATGLKIATNLLRRRHRTHTQTRKSGYERWENVQDAFCLAAPLPPECRHLLLVDDVITTGATLTACALALCRNRKVKISILTLGVAR